MIWRLEVRFTPWISISTSSLRILALLTRTSILTW
ncbi:hypothetical protein LINPERPRIM_LOCUS42927 [Linum perenne]